MITWEGESDWLKLLAKAIEKSTEGRLQRCAEKAVDDEKTVGVPLFDAYAVCFITCHQRYPNLYAVLQNRARPARAPVQKEPW